MFISIRKKRSPSLSLSLITINLIFQFVFSKVFKIKEYELLLFHKLCINIYIYKYTFNYQLLVMQLLEILFTWPIVKNISRSIFLNSGRRLNVSISQKYRYKMHENDLNLNRRIKNCNHINFVMIKFKQLTLLDSSFNILVNKSNIMLSQLSRWLSDGNIRQYCIAV